MEYLIIGAGPCGLAAAHALKEAGIPYEHVEADSGLGGNWLHGVYAGVYTDACKDVMQFPAMPMPAHYPDFLSQAHMLTYLNNFADRFLLREKIKFNTRVVWIDSIANNQWNAHFEHGQTRTYSGIIICSGHHWDMRFAELHGPFSGSFIHSKEYKEPSQIKDLRVLVIGAGNSAADIACEAARVSRCSVLSMKDSPWIFPKTFMGIPLGRIKLKYLPAFVERLLMHLLIRISFGRYENYHLPHPKHKLLSKHPTVSEELPYYLKHGRITVKPAIIKTDRNTVWFADNTHLDFDLIVSATGFNLSYPFLPESLIRITGQNLHCFGYCAYPDYKGLFFLGWPQVRGGIGQLASAFSKVIADLIRVEEFSGQPAGLLLKMMGNKLSRTHLYGGREVLNWIGENSTNKLFRNAGRLKKEAPHENLPTECFRKTIGDPEEFKANTRFKN